MVVAPGSALTPLPMLGTKNKIPFARRLHIHMNDAGNARMHRKGPQQFQLNPATERASPKR